MEKTKSQFNKTKGNVKLILIAIGSNLNSEKYGSPEKNCIKAIQELKNFFVINKISNFYRSEPIPYSKQSWFVNCAIEILTKTNPMKILEILFSIENSFGRIRKTKNEPRVIDLDLLAYNNQILSSKKLVIPHPRLHERNFVLFPILDLNPNWIHPILKKSVRDLVEKSKNIQKIKKIELRVE